MGRSLPGLFRTAPLGWPKEAAIVGPPPFVRPRAPKIKFFVRNSALFGRAENLLFHLKIARAFALWVVSRTSKNLATSLLDVGLRGLGHMALVP